MNLSKLEVSDNSPCKIAHYTYHTPDWSVVASLHLYADGEMAIYIGDSPKSHREYNVPTKQAIARFTRICYLLERRYYRASVNVF